MLALMAGAMLFGACSKEAVFDNTENLSEGNMTFTATVSDGEGEATRTHLGESNSVLWSDDDMISIFSNGDHNKFTLASGANTSNGKFVGTCDTGGDIYAIYPYSKNNEVNILSNGTLDYSKIVWNGANQTAVKNSFPLSTPMIACAKNIEEGATEIPLSFQNVCAIVKFTTDYVCKKVVFSANESNVNLASKNLIVDYDTNGKPHINTYDGGSKTITLTGKDGANLEPGTYYFAVMPEELDNGFIISFTNIYDETTLTKSTTKSVTLKRNTILNLGKFNIKGKLSGIGTEDDPYLIHDYDQLVEMRDFVNNSTGGADCYKLMNDIDGNGNNFTSIGTQAKPFFGKFDGNGKKISNLKLGQLGNVSILSITSDDLLRHAYISALFAVVKDATIKNVTIDNMSLYDNSDTYMRPDESASVVKSPFIGVVLGTEGGETEIYNVTINNSQNMSFAESNNGGAKYMLYGGVVGASLGNLHIDKCTNKSQISAPLYCAGSFGGILGIALGGQEDGDGLDFDSKARIERCRNFGDISPQAYNGNNWKSGEPLNAGGIVGCFKDETFDDNVCGDILNCVNFGAINTKTTNSPKERVGGVLGSMDSDGFGESTNPAVANCINNGDITTSSNAGGIIGYVYDRDTGIEFCANTAKIDCQSPGSILGYYSDGPRFRFCWNNNTSCPYMCNNTPAGTSGGGSSVNCWPLSDRSVYACVNDMNWNKVYMMYTSEYDWKVYDEDDTKLDLDF